MKDVKNLIMCGFEHQKKLPLTRRMSFDKGRFLL